MVDLVSNQKLLWQQGSFRDDGRIFDSSPLDQSDGAELVKEVTEARMALIEQVADLDDEFAELLLRDFSDNFDAIPSSEVSMLLCWAQI